MKMEWSLDFCLVCDRQTFGGAYCSQACRLAELDRFSAESGPPSPTAPNTRILFGENVTGLMFPPTTNFTTYKSPAGGLGQTLATPLFHEHVHSSSNVAQSTRVLSPSSSQTSLSSLQSNSSFQSNSSQSPRFSDQVRNELRDYASCFDQVRDWKRRLTTS